MSFLAEWQKQQKALKDAERDRKKNASSLLNNYRGGENDIKHEKQLKAIKDADRDNKKNASSFLKKYRGGEHDIKNEKQLKAIKDADRDNKKRASTLLNSYKGGEHDVKDNEKQMKAYKDAQRDNKKNASSLLHSYKGGEHDVKENEKQMKAYKDAQRDNKKNASSLLHSYKGGEHDVKENDKQMKAYKDAQRDNKKNASSLLHSYKGGEHDVKDYEREIINERRSSHVRKFNPDVMAEIATEESNETPKIAESHSVPNASPGVSPGIKSGTESSHTRKKLDLEKFEQMHVSNGPAETKSSTAEIDTGKSRKPLMIDFSFGIILSDEEPKPDAEECASAASAIVPHVISQWTSDTKIFCNPKTPEVVGEVIEDDWYDGDESIRYKVKGKVAVQVFSESSMTEVAEGLTKVLRRHVSFRPLYEGEKTTGDVIGDGDQKWMRVREGRLSGLGITF